MENLLRISQLTPKQRAILKDIIVTFYEKFNCRSNAVHSDRIVSILNVEGHSLNDASFRAYLGIIRYNDSCTKYLKKYHNRLQHAFIVATTSDGYWWTEDEKEMLAFWESQHRRIKKTMSNVKPLYKLKGYTEEQIKIMFEDECYWIMVKDGHPSALELFGRHYSKYHYKDGRKPKLFVGPGEKIVLIGKNHDALFVWRKFISMDHQKGICCAVFRNESNILSSILLMQAELIAKDRWPKERFYTYINPRKIKSINPGYCFKLNGWKACGITKARKLLILEK